MISAAEEFRREGRREGVAGFFLRQLSEQFGDLSDEVVQRVRAVDSDALAEWGLSFRSAESLDDVFSSGAGNGHGSNGKRDGR